MRTFGREAMKVGDATGHFVPADRVPVLPICSSARAAYEILGTSKIGGLIAQDGELPLYYVTAAFLDWAIRLLGQLHGVEYATLLPLRDYLLAFFDKSPVPGATILTGFPGT